MRSSHSKNIQIHFNTMAPMREKWQKRARYYHKELLNTLTFLVPKQSSVLEIGCGLGDLLDKLEPRQGVGIDIAAEMIVRAKKRHPQLDFHAMDAEHVTLQQTFEYVLLPDVIGNIEDVQACFESLHRVTNKHSRVVITSFNPLWEGLLNVLELLHIKMPQPKQNWLSKKDIEHILALSGFEVVKQGNMVLVPVYIPFITAFCNRYLARLPFIRTLCLSHYVVARPEPAPYSNREFTVSVVIPARNEAGNIESAIERITKLGSHTEIIFIEGGSTDNTQEEITRVKKKYEGKRDIISLTQDGKGKGDAVRKAFAHAKGDVLMILDADLTVPPEELSKFYQALRTGRGEFVMGSRLVYPMENGAMRFLNILGNKFFSVAFSWLLSQPIKDTLCGTKVLFRSNYNAIARNRSYFGDFDPFGDFDLIFGAAKLNLKIVEIPIRYQARTYGSTNISRFRHGLVLLKMTAFAARKLKFRK